MDTDFTLLMELAARQTQASQLALAKETQLRLAREKTRMMQEDRKEHERLLAERARIAKRKQDNEISEQRLQEDRKRRLAQRAAASATAAAAAQSSRDTSKAQSKRPKASTPASRRPGTSSALKNLDMDPGERRQLEREEKAARAKARIFEEPYKKPSTSKPRKPATASAKPKTVAPKPRPVVSTSAGTGVLSARQRIEQEFNVDERRPLNQIKRDRRTIEEVERDMRLRKALPEPVRIPGSMFCEDPRVTALRREKEAALAKANPGSQSVSSLQPFTSSSPPTIVIKRKPVVVLSVVSTSSPLNPSAAKRPRIEPPTAPVAGPSQPRVQPQASGGSTSKTKRVVEESEDSDSDSEPDAGQQTVVPAAVRDEIWKIMGKKRSAYTRRDVYSDEEESEDMEVAAGDVLAEEREAAAAARREDLREQEALKKREADKKRRLSIARSPK